MNNNYIKEILYIIIAILLGIVAVKFVMWLLPIILFAMVSHYIYKAIKQKRPNGHKKTKKTIKIIEMVEDDN